MFAPQFDAIKQTYLSETIGFACGRWEAGGYALPDVVVADGFPAQFDSHDNILNPLGVIEILSPSTRMYDRGLKLENYFACSTLREIALIDQKKMAIEWFQLNSHHRWERYLLEHPAEQFAFLGANATVADVYRDVELEAPAPLEA